MVDDLKEAVLDLYGEPTIYETGGNEDGWNN